MKKHLFLAITLSLFLVITTRASGYGGFTIKGEFSTRNAHVTEIICTNKPDIEYHIYKFNISGPNFRVIRLPDWKTIGGRDYYSFSDAVDAACE